jgi:hypothetical protein
MLQRSRRETFAVSVDDRAWLAVIAGRLRTGGTNAVGDRRQTRASAAETWRSRE